MNKEEFFSLLQSLTNELNEYVCSDDGQRKIKGFVDELLNVYTISSDTKIISKILEIHIFPKILEFADNNGFDLETPQEQNYYPDISLILRSNRNIKFAVDFKSTYRVDENKCNGFTLGSHGEYFINRNSTKNIQYPYGSYMGHYCLGMIYDKADVDIDETEVHTIETINEITSVISNITFFVQEKWKIASDSGGSGNTANIGSIKDINKLISGQGVFMNLGEAIFDEYWMNYGRMQVPSPGGGRKPLSKIEEFVDFKNLNRNLINKPRNRGQ